MPSISLPETAPRPRTAPRLEKSVAGDSRLAVTSFEQGSTTHAATAAKAKLRPARLAVQQPLETEFPHGAGHRRHMSMWQRTAQGHGVVSVRENGATLKQKADALHEVGLKFGEIVEDAPFDVSVFPPGLPHERRGDASVIGNVFDVG